MHAMVQKSLSTMNVKTLACFYVFLLMGCTPQEPSKNFFAKQILVDSPWVSVEDSSLNFRIEYPEKLHGEWIGVEIHASSSEFHDVGYFSFEGLSSAVAKLNGDTLALKILKKAQTRERIKLYNPTGNIDSITNSIFFTGKTPHWLLIRVSVNNFVVQDTSAGEHELQLPDAAFVTFIDGENISKSSPRQLLYFDIRESDFPIRLKQSLDQHR